MKAAYNRHKLRLYERRAQSGRKLAYRAELASDKSRQKGKTLKVTPFPQSGGYVPSVRVAGKWLERIGFRLGDEVILIASEGQVIITKKEVPDHGSSVV